MPQHFFARNGSFGYESFQGLWLLLRRAFLFGGYAQCGMGYVAIILAR